MSLSKKQQYGRAKENEACVFLEQKGLILIEQNYINRHGEIDLIMEDKEHIVFVEVRSRNRTDFGNALESIDYRKQQKLIKTSTYFLQMKNWLYKVNSRFDIIAIHPSGGKIQLEWFQNAFTVDKW